ncbi:alcohol dehydrogenase catalytic domain-containing protein [Sphingomonas sp. NFR15]|uniref:alcohol dehydrogenase catalytic domain-containing protein n=1 Tax=Sphingomonas sp. NFR15 TaxID=1566282 RepID=UPI00210D69A0|nr:NADH oxidase [Sphingomonas sp. NFR15]
MSDLTSLEMRSRIDAAGALRLSFERTTVGEPAADEVIVRIEAAPINPSDVLLLLGPADPATLRASGSGFDAVVDGTVPRAVLPAIAGRVDRSLPVGNEGAGTVVRAGRDVEHLVGRLVALRASTGTCSQYQRVKAGGCLVLPDGLTARAGAAAFINPLTALGMTETMRREGHVGLVHTAAASNLGQMLNRLCLADGIPLVNIVRSSTQETLLRDQGARHVLDSTAPGFADKLVDALEKTGATLAFDAIGGGRMASDILIAMETVAGRKLTQYSRYGSPTRKQVYIYGVLDPGPKVLGGPIGMSWGVGGWLMSWFYDTLPATDVARLRQRVADNLGTIFASRYTAEIGLAEALSLDVIRAYSRRATGEKYLIAPQRGLP